MLFQETQISHKIVLNKLMRDKIYFILFFVIASCQSSKTINFQNDVFLSKNNGTIVLNKDRYKLYEIKGNGHVLIYSGSSEGNFKQVSKTILKFNSDRNINWWIGMEELSFDIKQSISKTDSIIIKIKNLSEFKSAFKSPIDIKYIVEVDGQVLNESLQVLNKDVLVIPYKLKNYSVVNLSLQFEYNNRWIAALQSNSDFNFNSFEINLPKLKEEDFTYIYLDGDYVLIQNDIISWNGQEYEKQKN
jgi:hypothetical protein